MRVSVLVALAAMAVTVTVVCGGFPGSYLSLERTIPLNHQVELTTLKARDEARHRGRILQDGGSGGILDFSVQGTSDPYLVG